MFVDLNRASGCTYEREGGVSDAAAILNGSWVDIRRRGRSILARAPRYAFSRVGPDKRGTLPAAARDADGDQELDGAAWKSWSGARWTPVADTPVVLYNRDRERRLPSAGHSPASARGRIGALAMTQLYSGWRGGISAALYMHRGELTPRQLQLVKEGIGSRRALRSGSLDSRVLNDTHGNAVVVARWVGVLFGQHALRMRTQSAQVCSGCSRI